MHVGTLHLKAKAVLEDFEGDIHEGDVFAVNDPYRGGTHFPDFSLIRPVFADGELIALAQANGHWADVGGSRARLVRRRRDRPLRRGHPRPADPRRGQGHAARRRDRDDRVQLTRARRHRRRLPRADRGHARGRAGALPADRQVRHARTSWPRSAQVQDYVERLTRARIADLPDGEWETDRPRRLRSGRRGGPGHRQGQAHDRRRRDHLRPQRLRPGDQELPQLRRGRGVLRRDRLRQDVPARDPAELRLLPRDQGRRRAGGHDRQRGLAERGHRVASPAPTRRS